MRHLIASRRDAAIWALSIVLLLCFANVLLHKTIGRTVFETPRIEGVYFRDITAVDREAVCASDELVLGMLRIDEDYVHFPSIRCAIVYRDFEAWPMAGEGPLYVVVLGYACGESTPGPRNTSGDVALISERLANTGYIDVPGDPRGYVPTHSNYLRCPDPR